MDRGRADNCRMACMLQLQRNADIPCISNNMRRAEPTPVQPRKAACSSARTSDIQSIFSLSRCNSEKRICLHMNIPDTCAFSSVFRFFPFLSTSRSFCQTLFQPIHSFTAGGKSECTAVRQSVTPARKSVIMRPDLHLCSAIWDFDETLRTGRISMRESVIV
jgi:hypothetical protein